VGWVRFIGEFALYESEQAAGDRGREGCVSGALPLEQQRLAAEKFEGKRVRITASEVAWELPDPLALSLNHAGSPITNWCGGSFVLFASNIRAE
jgi:hypothetical protein